MAGQSASLVDSITACQDAVALLFQEAEVAIDIEGVSLSRAGEDCIIQIYAPSTSHAYLFDITSLQEDAYGEGGLKELLESESVLKVFFDVRGDNDALFHLHNVRVRGAYDLQILYDVKFSHPLDQKLLGLQKVMQEFFKASEILSPAEMRALEALKERGRNLFVPALGGSYEVWKQRPLSQELITYAAADVKFMLDMKRYWGAGKDVDETQALDTFVRNASMERLERFVQLPERAALDQENKKNRDFEIQVGFNHTGHIFEKVFVPSAKRGLVIGKRGATIQGIESQSGARASFDNENGIVKVIGTPAQVRAAERLIQAKMSEDR